MSGLTAGLYWCNNRDVSKEQPEEPQMPAITADQITAPGTYLVTNAYGANSSKRFKDAIENLKRINGSDGCSATYNGQDMYWTVVLADTEDGRVFAASRLRAAVTSYSAIVELVPDRDDTYSVPATGETVSFTDPETGGTVLRQYNQPAGCTGCGGDDHNVLDCVSQT
jgi:hypothetical protein